MFFLKALSKLGCNIEKDVCIHVTQRPAFNRVNILLLLGCKVLVAGCGGVKE